MTTNDNYFDREDIAELRMCPNCRQEEAKHGLCSNCSEHFVIESDELTHKQLCGILKALEPEMDWKEEGGKIRIEYCEKWEFRNQLLAQETYDLHTITNAIFRCVKQSVAADVQSKISDRIRTIKL
jgi:hypothetical protein